MTHENNNKLLLEIEGWSQNSLNGEMIDTMCKTLLATRFMKSRKVVG